MVKLIASDLDGTLLKNGAQELNTTVFQQILALRENGIYFVAASGRQYENLRRLFAPVKDDISYIAENGSLCIHKGNILARGRIPKELGSRIVDIIHSIPGCDCIISGERVCYTDSINGAFIDHMVNVVGNDMKTVSHISEIPEPFLKISVCNFNGTQECLSYLQECFSKEIKIVTSGNVWVDFIAPNANKGSALQVLLDHLNISPQDCIAFGDQYNDVEMLQTAGTSYAMSSGAPGIYRYSTHVTSSVEAVLSDILASAETKRGNG